MTASRRPLRIAILGDLDSIHTQRWLRAFVARGHEMHAISFYPPKSQLEGVTLHVLRNAAPSDGALPLRGRVGERAGSVSTTSPLSRVPPSLLRPLHALRYKRAGLKETLAKIAPDVLHTHYVVEYGFYGAMARFRPTVVSAWGSDVYVAPRNPLTNLIARWTLRKADFVTASDAAMLEAARKLGAKRGASEVVRIGALEELFFEDGQASVNLEPRNTPPTVLSTRALEPLYNIDVVLRAFARARGHVTDAHLVVAHDGSQRRHLEALAAELGLGDDKVSFVGRLKPEEVRDALSAAHIYVSVPSSDSMSASTMEAMARGCFPIVSDLASQDGFIEHGVSGLQVTAGNVDSLSLALQRALVDAELRRQAMAPNRARIEAEGRLSAQVEKLEAVFYSLVDS